MKGFIAPTTSQKFALIRPAKGGVGYDADMSATEVITKLDAADFWEVCGLSKKVTSNVIKAIRKDDQLREDIRDDVNKVLGVKAKAKAKAKKAKAPKKTKKAKGRNTDIEAAMAAIEAQLAALKAML